MSLSMKLALHLTRISQFSRSLLFIIKRSVKQSNCGFRFVWFILLFLKSRVSRDSEASGFVSRFPWQMLRFTCQNCFGFVWCVCVKGSGSICLNVFPLEARLTSGSAWWTRHRDLGADADWKQLFLIKKVILMRDAKRLAERRCWIAKFQREKRMLQDICQFFNQQIESSSNIANRQD